METQLKALFALFLKLKGFWSFLFFETCAGGLKSFLFYTSAIISLKVLKPHINNAEMICNCTLMILYERHYEAQTFPGRKFQSADLFKS